MRYLSTTTASSELNTFARSRLDPGEIHAGAYSEHRMAKLTTQARKKLPLTTFGLPGKRAFPLNDKKHDKAAISGASRSYNAGNISASQKAMIDAKARKKLRKH